MNWDNFEAKANDIWGEFCGMAKFLFWDGPILLVQIASTFLLFFLLILFIALIVGGVIFLLSITF